MLTFEVLLFLLFLLT